jgi:hypothetical protein
MKFLDRLREEWQELREAALGQVFYIHECSICEELVEDGNLHALKSGELVLVCFECEETIPC